VQPVSKHFQTISVLIALVATQAFLSLRLAVIEGVWIEPPKEESVKWDPRIFKILTFGHLSASVDWLWMRAMADPALAKVTPGSRAASFTDLELASDLEPAFFVVYTAGVGMLAIVRNDVEGAKKVLEKGEHFRKFDLPNYSKEFQDTYWPNPWRLPLLMAYMNLFEFDDLSSAIRSFQEASEIPGSPPYLDRLVSRLNQPGGTYEVGLRLLNFMIGTSSDDRTKEGLEKKRESLRVAQFLDSVTREFHTYLQGKHKGGATRENWEKFLSTTQKPQLDPWGGQLGLDEKGRVTTTTPREKVFGIN